MPWYLAPAWPQICDHVASAFQILKLQGCRGLLILLYLQLFWASSPAPITISFETRDLNLAPGYILSRPWHFPFFPETLSVVPASLELTKDPPVSAGIKSIYLSLAVSWVFGLHCLSPGGRVLLTLFRLTVIKLEYCLLASCLTLPHLIAPLRQIHSGGYS